MNVIYINSDTIDMLDEWGLEYKRLVLINGQYNRNYFSKCKIILNNLSEHYLYVEEKRDYIKMTLHEKDGMIAKIKAYYTPDGENDYTLQISSATYELDENLTHIAKSASATYFLINSFFIYGNLTEGKDVVIKSKTQGNDKVFTFRKFEDKLYAIQTTAHRSPEGIFSVRGHFRKYKDGKIIWIDEYLKGVNKE